MLSPKRLFLSYPGLHIVSRAFRASLAAANRVFLVNLIQINTSLTSLDVDKNNISHLPPIILPGLRRLKKFKCSSNPWINPPEKVMDKGLKAIIRFMTRLEAEGKETCHLAMLAILGKGEVSRLERYTQHISFYFFFLN